VPEDLAGEPPWECGAAYVIAGSAAGLLTASDAAGWAAAALDEFSRTPAVPSLMVSPGLEACQALGHLAGVTTEEQARQFLGIAEPWVEREPNHYGIPMSAMPRPTLDHGLSNGRIESVKPRSASSPAWPSGSAALIARQCSHSAACGPHYPEDDLYLTTDTAGRPFMSRSGWRRSSVSRSGRLRLLRSFSDDCHA
jgi:hypothetical protein